MAENEFHFNWVRLRVYSVDIVDNLDSVKIKKITKELSSMTLKSDAKLEEKLTRGLENDTKNLANVYQTT